MIQKLQSQIAICSPMYLRGVLKCLIDLYIFSANQRNICIREHLVESTSQCKINSSMCQESFLRFSEFAHVLLYLIVYIVPFNYLFLYLFNEGKKIIVFNNFVQVWRVFLALTKTPEAISFKLWNQFVKLVPGGSGKFIQFFIQYFALYLFPMTISIKQCHVYIMCFLLELILKIHKWHLFFKQWTISI